MSYVGDIADQQPFVFFFTTRKDTGLPTTLSGTPVLSVYKDGGLTQTTVGPTLTVDFDAVTGLNKVAMAITDAFYVPGSDYSVVITTGTVNAISVVGEVVADFSIERTGGALALLKNASYGLAKLLRSTTPANTLNVDANNRAESLLGAVTHTGATVPTVTTLSGHTAQTADHAANISSILTDTGTTLENHLTDIKGTGFVKDTDSLPQCLTATGFSTHAAADVWSVATRALTDKAGFSLSQTFPTNFSSMAISGGGAVDSLVQGFLNTAIVETTAGNIAANFDNFYDNADAITTKVIDNVGVGAGAGLTSQNVRDAMKLAPTAGAPSAGSVDEHLDTIETDTNDLQTNQGNWLTATGFATSGALTSHDGKLDTAQTDLDTLTGTDGATLATAQANYAPNKVVPDAAGVAPTAVEVRQEMDTNSADLNTLITNLATVDTVVDAIKLITDALPNAGALTTIGTDTARLTAVRAAALTDLIDGGRLDLLIDAIKVVTDAQARAAATIVDGAAVSGTLSTTEMTTGITVTVADQFNGRQLVFANDTTTVALRGQATDITATTITGSKLGFTALTTAPVVGDVFSIV